MIRKIALALCGTMLVGAALHGQQKACGWVMWQEVRKGDKPTAPVSSFTSNWSPDFAAPDFELCLQRVKQVTERMATQKPADPSQAYLLNYDFGKLAVMRGAQTEAFFNFVCLPDTVDPRERKN